LIDKLHLSGSKEFTDLLSGAKYNTNDIAEGVGITLPAMSGLLLEF
jgi:hypothetical protein